MPEPLLDAAGRRRSPATMPGFHAVRPPRNKGVRYRPSATRSACSLTRRVGRYLDGGLGGAPARPEGAGRTGQSRSSDRLSGPDLMSSLTRCLNGLSFSKAFSGEILPAASSSLRRYGSASRRWARPPRPDRNRRVRRRASERARARPCRPRRCESPCAPLHGRRCAPEIPVPARRRDRWGTDVVYSAPLSSVTVQRVLPFRVSVVLTDAITTSASMYT
jgi:hypothetical protein